MLAYAASRPRVGARQSSPNALLFVISAHIVLLAVAMSAKMALDRPAVDPPTTVYRVPIQTPPPPAPVQRAQHQQKTDDAAAPLPQPDDVPRTSEAQVPLNFGSSLDPAPGGGVGTVPLPPLPQPIPPVGVTMDAQLATPPSDLRPPYPQSKLLAEEEASLRLRLTIDDAGRVTAVEPVGRADPIFLAAARKHLLAHWRYKPAMKDGRAVPSSVVITLRFELDG